MQHIYTFCNGGGSFAEARENLVFSGKFADTINFLRGANAVY